MRGVHLASFNHWVGSFAHSAWESLQFKWAEQICSFFKNKSGSLNDFHKVILGFCDTKYPEHKFTTVFIQRSFLLSYWRLIGTFGLYQEPPCMEEKSNCQQGMCKSPFSANSTWKCKFEVAVRMPGNEELLHVFSVLTTDRTSLPVIKEMKAFSVWAARRCFPFFRTWC